MAQKPKFPVTDEQSFLALMEGIDAELREQEIPVTRRDMSGLHLISSRYRLGLSMSNNLENPEPGNYQGKRLTRRIFDWFADQYGDRLKIDPLPGHTMLLIDGDLFRARIPKIFGIVQIAVDAFDMGNDHPFSISKNGPGKVNILNQIEGLTEARARRLSQEQLSAICTHMTEFTNAFNEFSKVYGYELGKKAEIDFRSSVARAVDHRDFGTSRYETLQAAEKIIKLYLTLKTGTTPSYSHILTELIENAPDRRIASLSVEWLDAVQCSANVRYEASGTVHDAVRAHEAAVRLVRTVATFIPSQQPELSSRAIAEYGPQS